MRGTALQVISYLGEPAKVIEEQLLKLRENEPVLIDSVNAALVGIKSQASGAIYADAISKAPDILMLRDIAELGINGIDAGSAVNRLLESDHSELRVFAARTLGFIEYIDSAPLLIQLLNDEIDVLLNFVAAESLGRMKAKAAIPALNDVALNHWYPAVRNAASKAIKHITANKPYENKFHRNNFPSEYFNFNHMGIEFCEETNLKGVKEPIAQKLYSTNAQEKLNTLKYNTIILGYGAGDEEEQLAEDPDAIIEVNQSNIVEYRNKIEQIPEVALRVNGGWLTGSSRGEWGGELVFISDSGEQSLVLEDNIEDIYILGTRYITTAGLAHMSSNNGRIYELYTNKYNKWKSRPWLKLPGTPRTSWFVETGELLINTFGGGSILLSEKGIFRMAECKAD